MGVSSFSRLEQLSVNIAMSEESSVPDWVRLAGAGACAGTVTKTSVAPMERIKMLMQAFCATFQLLYRCDTSYEYPLAASGAAYGCKWTSGGPSGVGCEPYQKVSLGLCQLSFD